MSRASEVRRSDEPESEGRREVGVEGRDLLAAQAGDERAFERLLAPHRSSLARHCYRMLGDVFEADDALQETMVRAWRHLAGFEPRAPFRAWLYRIATNVCLSAIEKRTRRREQETRMTAAEPLDEALAHVTPFTDRPVDNDASDPHTDLPAARLVEEESVQVAFVAAGQLLPPRQRAVLLLRDVLDFNTAEVAAILETSPQAVNSALQRARKALTRNRNNSQLACRHAPASAAVERDLARRFASAWEAADVAGLVRLLADDALLTMPPEPLRVQGATAIGEFLQTGPFADTVRRFAARPTSLNGQPALALYREDPHRTQLRPYSILSLSIDDRQIASITRFAGLRLFPRLGLPEHGR